MKIGGGTGCKEGGGGGGEEPMGRKVFLKPCRHRSPKGTNNFERKGCPDGLGRRLS